MAKKSVSDIINDLRSKTQKLTGQLSGDVLPSTEAASSKIYNTISNALGQNQQPFVAPIPQEDVLSDPGRRYYIALDQMKQDWADRVNKARAADLNYQAALMQSNATPTPTPTPAQGNYAPSQSSSTPLNGSVNWQGFINSAKKVAKETGYPLSVILGQAALETAHGKSAPGNNFFGIKGSGTAGSQNLATQEANGNGQFYNTMGNFAAYNSPEDSIRAYVNLIKQNYPQAYAQRNNPVSMVQAIKAGGYATDPNYVNKVTQTPEFQQYAQAQPQRQVLAAKTAAAPAKIPAPPQKSQPFVAPIPQSQIVKTPPPKPNLTQSIMNFLGGFKPFGL